MRLHPAIRCAVCGSPDLVAVLPADARACGPIFAAWCERHWPWSQCGGLQSRASDYVEPETGATEMDEFASFDTTRQAFLSALRDFLDDPTKPVDAKCAEVTATISAMRQIAALKLGVIGV